MLFILAIACTKLQYLQFERIKRNVNTICLCGKMSIQKYQSISIITISSSIYIITVKLTQRIIDLHMSFTDILLSSTITKQ